VPPVLSVVVPTRNRAHLWRRGWLLNPLRQICQPGLELVVVDDNSTDDTIGTLSAELTARRLACPVTLARCLSPIANPDQASAAPDNVAFALAAAPLVLHFDDDLRPHPEVAQFVLGLDLTRSILWLQYRFTAPDGSPQTGPAAADSRLRFTVGHQTIAPLCKFKAHHWGSAWAVHAADFRAIGGHNMALRGARNSDTRLGTRLVRHGLRSLLALDYRGIYDHLGPTWYMLNKHNHRAVRENRRDGRSEPVIANGGADYWSSPDCLNSFEVIDRIYP